MHKALNNLLYSLPTDGKDYSYACSVCDLDDVDVPKERTPKLKELMHGADDYLAVEAAKVLTCWGDDEAFDFLESFVCDRDPPKLNWMPHRLHGYDDNYKHILDAITMYEGRKIDSDPHNKFIYRKKIVRPITKIIELSNSIAFKISGLFYRVADAGYTEYIPALKAHLEAILKNPAFHH